MVGFGPGKHIRKMAKAVIELTHVDAGKFEKLLDRLADIFAEQTPEGLRWKIHQKR